MCGRGTCTVSYLYIRVCSNLLTRLQSDPARSYTVEKRRRHLKVLEWVRLFPTSTSPRSAPCTSSTIPASTASSASLTPGKGDVTLDLFVDRYLGDLGHQVVGHVFHVRLDSGRVERCVMAQVRKVERVGGKVGLQATNVSALTIYVTVN